MNKKILERVKKETDHNIQNMSDTVAKIVTNQLAEVLNSLIQSK